jgi:acetyl/propionyl-CoA carboxylase alpha subunit
VSAGQGLVVMEADEDGERAARLGPGTVRAVHAEPGAAVNKGAVLVELA